MVETADAEHEEESSVEHVNLSDLVLRQDDDRQEEVLPISCGSTKTRLKYVPMSPLLSDSRLVRYAFVNDKFTSTPTTNSTVCTNTFKKKAK